MMNLAGWKNKTGAAAPFVVQLLMIMFVVEFVKGALLLTILPVYMKTVLGATAFVVGWSLAAQYIGDNVFRTPVGWLIDKAGYRLSMLIGILLSGGSVLIMATFTHHAWMVAACAMLGVGTAPLWPAVIAGTTEVAGDKAKGTIMSVVYMAWLSGTGLGPVVINFFIHGSNYGPAYRLLLISMGVVLLIALFLPRKPLLRESGEENRRASAAGAFPAGAAAMEAGADPLGEAVTAAGGGAAAAAAVAADKKPLGERMRLYMMEARASLREMNVSRLLFPAMFIQTFALGVLTPILTLYAREVLHLSPGQYSMLLILGGGAAVALLVPVGKLVDRKGIKGLLTAGLIFSSVSLLALGFIRQLAVVYAVVGLLGIGYALIIPSWNALIASCVPKEKRGAVWGFFLTIEGLGMIVGPIVSGKLWDAFGPSVPFTVSGSVLLLLLVLQWRILAKSRG
ncbi:MFS transporter [Paenibacillus sp. UNC499MF]|uniref:MFS transporter n=1 Tax=Paenibacillus sp. UNC499MF TaxID=1502751 RepID=UPI0008A03E2E|nr:MFS transporter [Paenibacillus sp. UNC499MF]SEF53310.1 Sugar phosphate permease [Paenibacillus sp. UNC499MF]